MCAASTHKCNGLLLLLLLLRASLLTLSLSVVTASTDNKITDVGATAIADSLKTNSTLQTLSLHSTCV